MQPDFSLEEQLMQAGHAPVCGIDEAGRGPLAGPVVAACVILRPERIPQGLADSKKLSSARRARLAGEILAHAHVGVAQASAEEIDRLNIHHATLLAMRRAFEALARQVEPAFALVDGKFTPDLPCPARAEVKGDGRALSIAAASIVAKVERDRIMAELEEAYPGYGFAAHKGYPTKAHIEALQRLGPCPEHRRSYRPVADCVCAAESFNARSRISRM